jgi:putative aldouronate transport system substrate-binding protein
MKRSVKLIFTAVLVLALASSVYAGGGGQRGGGAAQIDRSNFNALGAYPLVKNKENITVLTVQSSLSSSLDESWLTGWYEEKTNVHVNWQYAPEPQFKERVNLALASAEKLDLILGYPWGGTGFTQSEFLRLATQGLIYPIGDLFESDTVNIKKNIDSLEGFRAALTMPDGHIYIMPDLEECLHCAYYGKMWINKEFLKNTGITKYPETLEEFRAMLIAFRDKDANGNGDPNDEIPFMGTASPGSYSSRVDTYLMTAFVYDDGLDRLYLNSKKVTAAYQQNAFRDGLKYLNGLFKERLISRDSFSIDTDTRGKINSQKYESIIGAIPYEHHHNMGSREAGQPVRWTEYEAIPPLKGPGGQVARYDPYLKFRIRLNGSMVPVTSKNPALIARWLDYFHTWEGTLTGTIGGGKGIMWDDADPNAASVGGGKPVYKVLTLKQGDQWYQKAGWSFSWPFVPTFRRTNFWADQQGANPLSPDGTGIESYLYQITEKNYQPYGKSNLAVPPLWYSPEDASEMALLTTNINTYVEESIAKFVVGDLDPNRDADWNTFQSQLKNLGIDKYLQIIQKTYNASAFAK